MHGAYLLAAFGALVGLVVAQPTPVATSARKMICKYDSQSFVREGESDSSLVCVIMLII